MPLEDVLPPASAFPQLAPKASAEITSSRQDTNRRKSSSKSRNGCVTCKARRIKCDETKPACNQCTRRRLDCGGYKKDIRFRNVVRPLAARYPSAQNDSSPLQYGDETYSATSPTACSRGHEDTQPGRLPSPSILSWPFATSENTFVFDFANLESGHSCADFNAPPCFVDAGPVNIHQSTNQAFSNYVTREDAIRGSSFDLELDTLLVSPFPSPLEEPPELMLDASPPPEFEQVETLAVLFQDHTRRYLSMRDTTDENPWTKLVWPMTKTSKALFYAITGMTCMRYSKTSESTRQKGLSYVRKSKAAFDAELTDGGIAVESALAVTVAIGFAEAWDCGDPATLLNESNTQTLMQKSLSRIPLAPSPMSLSPSLKFLLNTCMYMDVMARLTWHYGMSLNTDFNRFDFQEPYVEGEKIDPLMGYATTLFPILGRVGDLVGEIRARSLKRNSPGIISRAIELRKMIESWAPTINLEQVDEPTANMSDAIQTAEAYRWSTLLLLQQAVPELPNLGSVGELGQRTLVYLATIPTTSQTIIAHTYPLMVAGTEAIDEDRDFVRERWRCMSQRMIPSNLDRCVEITEEVWQRRDAYLVSLDSSMQTETARTRLSSPISRPRSTDQGNMIQRDDEQESDPLVPSERAVTRRNSSISNHFPISAAFRRGVDPLTRSGNVEYTVKGRLHWLGVMKEWGWKLHLG